MLIRDYWTHPIMRRNEIDMRGLFQAAAATIVLVAFYVSSAFADNGPAKGARTPAVPRPGQGKIQN